MNSAKITRYSPSNSVLFGAGIWYQTNPHDTRTRNGAGKMESIYGAGFCSMCPGCKSAAVCVTLYVEESTSCVHCRCSHDTLLITSTLSAVLALLTSRIQYCLFLAR